MKYKTVAYIVDNAVLQSTPPREGYEASPIPADPSKSIVYAHWDNPNWEREFEELEGVTWLGFPWDPPPAETVPLLLSLQPDTPNGAARTSVFTGDAAPESLASMLRKTGKRIA